LINQIFNYCPKLKLQLTVSQSLKNKIQDTKEDGLCDAVERLCIRTTHPQILEHLNIQHPVWEPHRVRKMQHESMEIHFDIIS
jgi:hypothetical protein